MYFRKYHHPVNFIGPQAVTADGRLEFPGRTVSPVITRHGNGIFHLDVEGPGWEVNHSLAELTPPAPVEDGSTLAWEGGAATERTLVLRDAAGAVLLRSLPGRGLTVSGDSWLMEFVPDRELRYFGLGEKHLGWEKRKLRTKFWNTDAWADFHAAPIKAATYDPAYVSIPYLAMKKGDAWFGILIDTPEAPVIALPDHDEGLASTFAAARAPSFYWGAAGGRPSVWVLVGSTFAELTRKLQHLCGRTPLPPLWALGHHQCRWGYRSPADLTEVAAGYREHGIPNDGLWLDIDYMDAYKVFTWDPKHWSAAGGVAVELKKFADQGHPVVPILDPGVKVELGYGVYESGLAAGIFCTTREGVPYTGFVWPGETVFPDYSTAKGRAWWTDQVANWAKDGVGGAWLDMNDPAVGSAELDDMRFANGTLAHETHHNQYGLGMAIASRAGFLKAAPDRRPFLLCRSGWISASRYTAIWTGDNCSNWAHLKGSIALSMSLAISGVPFNGPDVPGFTGDVGPELAVAWYKAGFLFPFFRNHSDNMGNRREPWRFGPSALKTIGGVIRLRYRFLPYLYNLWIDQEETGAAVMRPLCYDHRDQPGQDLAAVGDQFCCGPDVLHAPVLDETTDQRSVVLPGGRWFNLDSGHWVEGGRTIEVRQGAEGTPLFVRGNAVLPLSGEVVSESTARDLGHIELHLFLEPGGQGETRYRSDDGLSYAYQHGARTAVHFQARREADTILVTARTESVGAGPVRFTVVVHGRVDTVDIVLDGVGHQAELSSAIWRPLSTELPVRRSGTLVAGQGH